MTVGGWFAVLPDGACGLAAARCLRPSATTVVDHGSGRPWLLGRRLEGQTTVALSGMARLAVIGRCPVTASALLARLGRIRDVVEVEEAVRGLPGSYHVVASVGGRVWVRGSASGVRLVFHARVGGATVAADRADVLASAIGADVEEPMLALRLLSLPPPYPLDTRSLWSGVEGVPPDHGLLIDPDGQARTRRWWSPPEPVLTPTQGASEVRRALVAAVGACTAGGGTVSADLSGGLDSTSLCFLAARGPARLVSLHWTTRDPGNDDTYWATRAATELSGTHRVETRSPSTFWYSDLSGRVTVRAGFTEEPGWVTDGARWAAGLALAAGEGSRLHLIGVGGDELFIADPAHLHGYVRSHPLAALGRIRRLRAIWHTPLRPLLAGLVDRRGFHQWLADWASTLDRPTCAMPHPSKDFSLSWGPEHRMPPWATPDAVNAVARLLGDAAHGEQRPLAPQRGQHAALALVQADGRSIRLTNQDEAADLETAAPYLDDAVIEAALSVRVADRNAPGRFKPVLADAMRTIVPDPLLKRSTKGAYTADLYHGLHYNRAAILELFADSALARAGLVDADVLRASLLGIHHQPHMMVFLDYTLGCELWLRTHHTAYRAPHTSATGVSL